MLDRKASDSMRRAAESDAEGLDVKGEGEPEKDNAERRQKEASDPEPESAYQRRIKNRRQGRTCLK